MNDAQYTFQQDLRDKKSIARSASHKVNGSKSRKCTLPSDYLTPAQKRKLNGDVEVYSLNTRMTWDKFKSMPVEHQESYLSRLVEAFDVNYVKLGKMFELSNAAIRQYVVHHDLHISPLPKKGNHVVEASKLDAWERFLEGAPIPKSLKPVGTDDAFSEDVLEIQNSNADSSISAEPAVHNNAQSDVMSVSRISVEFDGDINFNDIIIYLQLALGDKPHGHIQISFNQT